MFSTFLKFLKRQTDRATKPYQCECGRRYQHDFQRDLCRKVDEGVNYIDQMQKRFHDMNAHKGPDWEHIVLMERQNSSMIESMERRRVRK